MNIDIKKVKIIVMTPESHKELLRQSACENNAGVIENYTYCTTESKVVGTFRPNDDANPYIGTNNKLEKVEETKLEFICDVDKVKEVVAALKENHPYETPEIDIIPLLDIEMFN